MQNSAKQPPKRSSSQKQGGGRTGNAQALTRALAILKIVAAQSDGATLTEIARGAKLAPSTTHRLLTTLQEDRFVQFESHGARWLIGVEAFMVGSAFLQVRDIVRAARPFLHQLMEQSGETANLAIIDEDMAVYMSQVESRQTMRAICKPGGRVFLHSSALGKSMLALMAPEDVGRILAAKGMTRFTQRTLGTAERVGAQLAEVQATGFAIDDEEYSAGLRCVAAAVADERGRPLGALSVSGPAVRVTRERLDELGGMVRSIANELARELGGRAFVPPGDAAPPSVVSDISTMRNRSRPHRGRSATRHVT